MKARLDRRRFLRGAGVAIALPTLDSFTPRGVGEERPVKRLVCLSNNYGVYPGAFFPEVAGRAYVLPPTLEPLAPHREDFTVFSNLDHGISGGHACVPTLLSGVMPHLAAGFPEGNISLDQRAAEFVGARTRFPSMAVRVNEANLISFTRTGVQAPAFDLRRTYRALFLEESAEARLLAKERFRRHTSILDVVLDEAHSVRDRLGRQDMERFDQYLDSVRSLELKIEQETPWVDRPKPETELEEPQRGVGTEQDLRAMIELIALAIQTDSTRVVTLSSGFVGGDFGLSGGYHGFSHHGEREPEVAALMKIERNQVAQMAYLIGLLKAQPDPHDPGASLLDNTMVMFGCGMATGTHSTRNLPLLLAGGGFRLGEHLVLPEAKGQRVPAANLLLSMLQNFGLDVERFGTSTGPLPGLERR